MASTRNRWIAFILALLFGWLGFHRFYAGKLWTGLLYLVTAGWFGIGVLIDLIMILLGTFTDKQGNYIR